MAAISMLVIAASGSFAGSSAPTASKHLTIAYLQKQGDQQYFVDELTGAKAQAKVLGGVTVSSANLGSDASKTISDVQAAIAQHVDGIIIVPPDPAVGPQVISLAKDAKTPIISSDDQVCSTGPDPSKCAAKSLLPRVGFSGTQMGASVGKKAGQLFKAAHWTAGSDTVILAEWQQDVTVCTDRVKAAQVAFKKVTGTSPRVISVGTDNTPSDAQSKTAAILNTHQSVKHWVVWGCNDENVQGAVTALQNGSVNASNIIGVGLGAYLACKDWKSNKPSGMKAALFISGKDVGSVALKEMVAHIRNGKAFPHEAFAPTSMVTPANWRSAGISCS